MKKLNALIIASMTGLALAGGFLFADTVSAADYNRPPEFQQDKGPGPEIHKDKKNVEKANKPKIHKDKKAQDEWKDKKDQGHQRKLKPWEEKYYEQHPEARERDAQKGKPEKKNVQDDDGITWHRL